MISSALSKWEVGVTNFVLGFEVPSLCYSQWFLEDCSTAAGLLQEQSSLHHLATISNNL